MATNFPSSLDSFTNPTAVDTLDSPPHDTQHADANDAIEALQAKVGVDGSAVTTSIDYQLNTGYRYHSTVYFTSSGTFTKASYPWLRAVRVKVQGAGASGGGTDYIDINGEAAAAPGGGGGAYAESFITNIASLAASVTVTVGSGGTGGAGGTSGSPNGGDGVAGGSSSFGAGTAYEVSAGGGDNSSRGPEVSDVYVTGRADTKSVGVGDLVIPGSGSAHAIVIGDAIATTFVVAMPSAGGDSHLGAGGANPNGGTTTGNFVKNGYDGKGYGSGGGGGYVAAKTGAPLDGAAGGNGADGIIIVELYA